MTVCLLALGIAAPASAQQAASVTAAAVSEVPTAQELVVTAQKRSEKISEVPMSITAATGDTLRSKAIFDPSGLTEIEPSLQFAPSPYGTPIYTIRGVGYFEQSLAATPAVSIYQNEVPYLYPIMSKGALLDLDHVEILKGPQGILYGQNSTGGAINFDAAQPTRTLAAGVDATWARFNATHLDGYVSGPLTDTLSARLSASLDEGGAWQKSTTRNDTLGNKDLQTGRLILDWEPTDRFSARLNINGFEDHSQIQAAQLEGWHFSGPQYIAPGGTAQLTNLAVYMPNAALFKFYPLRVQQQVSEPIVQNPQAADWVAGAHPHLQETEYQGSLRMDYKLAPDIGLTSITSYQRFTQHDDLDDTGNAMVIAQGKINGNVGSFYQELRVHGAAVDGRLQWVVGANYQKDYTSELVNVTDYATTGTFLTGGSPFSTLHIAPFSIVGTPSHVDADTTAVFANLDYNLTDQIILHGGIRYTQSDQKFAGCAFTDGILGSLFGVKAGQCDTSLPDGTRGTYRTSLDQNNTPWRVGVDYKFAPDNMVYASISRGFKAGTSPALGAQTFLQLQPVKQEELTSYEVGLKSSLFDNTLQFTSAYFHYDYENKQVLGRFLDAVFGDLQGLVNIPQATEDGVEFAGTWRPVKGLTLNGSVTYLDSQVTSNFVNFASYVLSAADTVNFKGESFPFTPKWSLNYGGRYDWALNGDLNAFVAFDASWQSATNSAFGSAHAATEGPSLDNKAYGLLNLSAGISPTNSNWKVEVWGKNVTNTYYWNSAFYQFDPTVRLTGMPTSYGLTVSYKY
jgi:outer membrane receptor protein involved in Fe transport